MLLSDESDSEDTEAEEEDEPKELVNFKSQSCEKLSDVDLLKVLKS